MEAAPTAFFFSYLDLPDKRIKIFKFLQPDENIEYFLRPEFDLNHGTIDEPVGHCYDLAGLIHFDRVKAYEHNG